MNLKQGGGRVPIPTGDRDHPYVLVDFPSRQEFDTLYGNRVTDAGRERNWTVLTERSKGATLLQAGAPYSLTRERVRQIEAKFMRILAAKIRNA
jgi:hypothetical protein